MLHHPHTPFVLLPREKQFFSLNEIDLCSKEFPTFKRKLCCVTCGQSNAFTDFKAHFVDLDKHTPCLAWLT